MKFEFSCVDFMRSKVVKLLEDSTFNFTALDDGYIYDVYYIDIDTIEELIRLVDLLEEHHLLVIINNQDMHPFIYAVRPSS